MIPLILLSALSLLSFVACGPAVSNPISSPGPDPWIQYYNGNYYHTYSSLGDHIPMKVSKTIAGLKNAAISQVWNNPKQSPMWAPEHHLVNGKWYMYYTAGTGSDNLDNQRLHVLESTGPTPLGPYIDRGQIKLMTDDTWFIDGTILQLDGRIYLIYSTWDNNDQVLMIAPMSSPTTVSGPGVLISRPTLSWETQGLNVNEAPVALQRNGETMLIYSASFCGTEHYKLGKLNLVRGSDPMVTANWRKWPKPVFQADASAGVFGPAHNGFFKASDGSDWIVYHANDKPTDGCGATRTTRVQQFYWHSDGISPNFGTPAPLTKLITPPRGE
ncbi:Arabinanase/levansucrase/invertase [Powellomyces hirtus]|nr:Arabinanase/levansucrase/invertase [Powellomyces hirtus]